MKDKKISLIVAAYNEQENIFPFVEEILPILDTLQMDWEMLIVDDGSHDDTPNQICLAADRDPRITGYFLSRNFGKEAALSCGIDMAQGDVVIIIDADLQHPPQLIPQMIEKWQNGYEMVIPLNQNRNGECRIKKICSRLFYRILKRLSRIEIPSGGSDFRLMDKSVIQAIRRLHERTRFMKAIYAWPGFKTCTFPYEVRPRRHGNGKWPGWKLWNFALDGIFTFSSIPIRIWTYLGFVLSFLSFMYGLWIGIEALLYGIQAVEGVTTVAFFLFFFAGLLMISNGIQGEYLARIFEEVKQRPLYIIAKTTSDRK
jgi:glycosyltransferase involved in cell wall biosynthesis